MRVLFALPGLHRVDRGAEIAFMAIAKELCRLGHKITLIGSGRDRPQTPYRFLHARSVSREYFRSYPTMPLLRNDYAYEELTFIPDFLRQYRPCEFDVTLTCSYPFTNWLLRRPVLRGHRPRHIFVTENGDWPAQSDQSEFRFFGCDGLVCTNPDYLARNQHRWRCRLIPNGVDCHRFKPGLSRRDLFDLPADQLIVLMVSAFISTKRIDVGIHAVSRIPNAHLVVAGDGPLRRSLAEIGTQLMPGRFTQLTVAPENMPALYQSADVFLHLSKEEAFGNVFLEATACGLPVVAHDVARTRWVLGEDQFLTDTDDTASIIAAIKAAAAPGPQSRARGIERAARFSWTEIGKMYEAFFQEILG